MASPQNKIVIIAAPSGSGKTSVVRHLLKVLPDQLAFSISAATRSPRNYEKHGVSYEKAATVFADANGLGWEDMEHSAEESRLKQLGTYLGEYFADNLKP